MNKFNELYHTVIMESFDNDDAQVDEPMADASPQRDEEALKQLSIDVMKAQVEIYMKKWHQFGPFKIRKVGPDLTEVMDIFNSKTVFTREPFERWTANSQLGKAIKLLVKDPGMHGLSMGLYGSPELAALEHLMLTDFAGNPSDFGKRLAAAL